MIQHQWNAAVRAILIGCAAIMLLAVNTRPAMATSTDAQFEVNFRCPESLPDSSRRQEVADYLAWATKAHPNWKISDMIAYRYRLLQEHRCAATLAAIHDSSEKENAAAGGRFVCTSHKTRTFSPDDGPGCQPLPIETGWQNAVSSPSVIVDVNPSTIVQDSSNVKLWVHFYVAEAPPYISPDGVTRGRYNGIKGVWKFFCGKRQQMILQADYLLDDKPIYYRLSNEAITEEIEPDTISDLLYKKYCR